MLLPQANWFAVRVKPRHEKSVANILEYRGLEKLLPLYKIRRKWSDRVKQVELPLFPGYVFCKFDGRIRSTVLNSPGVIDIVRFGPHLVCVEPEEIDALQRVVRAGVPCEPGHKIQAGEYVTIDNGPLVGLSGKVVQVKSRLRLVLSVSLIQRTVLVELEEGWVRWIPTRANTRFNGLTLVHSSAQKSA